MTHVVCVKMGSRYGPEYVNRLEAMVRRHTSERLTFSCVTDDPVGLTCHPIVVAESPGTWWAKLRLFAIPWREQQLYLDLDTVIVNTIDPLLAYRGPFCIWEGLGSAAFNSSVMSIAPGFGREIWEKYQADRARIEREYPGDQYWITYMAPGADTWQTVAPGVIGSYKRHDLAESPKAFHVVCFHGHPKPHECTGWVAEQWR